EQFHYAIMKPIFDVLKHHYDVVMTADPIWIKKFDPDLVFVANRQAVNLRKLFPTAKFVYTRHGLISKNFAYDAARSCDFVCVSSEDQRKQFVEQGKFREEQIWVTGYSQMDSLFRNETPTVELPLRLNHKCVLYAPTFTRGLSSIPLMLPHMTKEFFNEMKDVDFVIKTHPLTQKTSGEWVAKLQEIGQTFENVHLVDDIAVDIIPFLGRADVLISDVSSVMFQYLALNRPIIALNNPDRFQVKEYDPSGIEWRWRDMATEINNMIDLNAVIKTCLTEPSKNSKIREAYRNSLFGTMTEGKTGERVLEYVQKLQFLEGWSTRD
ncbi:MAG: CDP-glycerol glycerophosphotransferase family protein, partial [Pseudomonas marincola]